MLDKAEEIIREAKIYLGETAEGLPLLLHEDYVVLEEVKSAMNRYANEVSWEENKTRELQFGMFVTEEFKKGTNKTIYELWNVFNLEDKP